MFRKKTRDDIFQPFTFMKKQLWPYLIGVIVNNAIMAFCFNIVFAIIMKDLFNSAKQGDKDLLIRAIIISVISLLFALIVQPIFVYISNKAQKKTMKRIRENAYHHMTELPISYFEKEHSGNIMSRLTNDIKIIENIYIQYIPRIVFVLVLGIGSTILMFIYEWRLTILAIGFEVLSVFVSVFIAKKIRKVSSDVQEKRSSLNSKFLDIIAGFKTTKIFQIEEEIIDYYKDENKQFTEKIKKRDGLSAIITTVGIFFYSIKSISLIVLGIYLISINMTNIGVLIAIFNLNNNMGILSSLGDAFGKIQSSMAGVDRVQQLMSEESETHQRVITKNKQVDNMIEFQDVSFSYGENNVLNNLSISVRKGESIALVGRSGCGKSTIVKLLLGFYEPNDGKIVINNQYTTSYSLDELRSKSAYVPQNPYLFDGTIKDNILYGRLNATEEEIVEAAKMANAHDFIIEQADGYDTYIGEGGANLSGGQKQRIAIARALIKDSPIIILDEATSALDSKAEEIIQETIERIMGERTIVIIAHRLSTIKKVDTIYVFNKGQVVESGNHQELLDLKGVYHSLYETLTYK